MPKLPLNERKGRLIVPIFVPDQDKADWMHDIAVLTRDGATVAAVTRAAVHAAALRFEMAAVAAAEVVANRD